MKDKLITKSAFIHSFFVRILLGLLILTAVAIVSVQSDLSNTQRTMSYTASYIKEQCNRYTRIELASETKSLMRIIESAQQISHLLTENQGSDTEDDLKSYARSSYVSGVVLLNADGSVCSQYHDEGQIPERIPEALESAGLTDIAGYPEKRYAVRLHCADGSEIDLSATARLDKDGIVVAYYHTPLEYIESSNLSISSLLSGYSMENDGTVVVSEGDTIVASNDGTLIGQSTNNFPILNRIKEESAGSKLVHAGQNGSSIIHQYFGLMERGRDVYVFTFLSGHNVFQSTPRVLLYSLILYMLALLCISVVRWKTAQRAQADFSERLKSKNEQLNEAVLAADRANAAKTSFLSRMSHDIRTPLNGIIGLLEIDATHPDDLELISANRGKMQITANHLLSLINDVLQMSKLESGEITLAHEAVELNAVTDEVMTIIEQKAAESGITLKTDGRSEPFCVPWVYSSPLHLRQIFLNIYTNCIKYNKPDGSISTLIRCVEKTEDTVTYRWTVSDTGIGMSKAFLQHIFDPFTQADTDARSVYQGTGLGMTIVKGLLDEMHGTIEVDSTEGVGSTFTVTVPFDIAEPAAASPSKDSTGQNADIRGLHLLLAEDNELNAEIAKILLEDAGASITPVADGKQAVEQFTRNPAGTFDAILMDIMMPVMDGLIATKAIRALDRPDAKTIPIIAMTANAFAEDAQKCLDAGMNAHLSKPLDIEKVKQTICEQIRKKQ